MSHYVKAEYTNAKPSKTILVLGQKELRLESMQIQEENDVNDILDDNGIFLLEFADLASIIKFNMFDTFCHEHLEYYSLKVISKMCIKNNLRIFDIKTNSINGGSIQLFICKEDATY